MVETSWTGDTRMEHQLGYIYPICSIVATTYSLWWWRSYNTTR